MLLLRSHWSSRMQRKRRSNPDMSKGRDSRVLLLGNSYRQYSDIGYGY
jgi:hypothetical protein